MKVFNVDTRFALCVIFCLLLVSCTNESLNNYMRNFNNRVEYGDINNYNYLSLDKRISNANLEQKLRVGLLLPLSGNARLIGESLLNSAQLSVFENSKNNIMLKVYDTKGTDFGAVEAINKAIEEGVDTIIGPLFYAETKAVSEIAKANNIVLFSLSNEQKLMNTDNVFVAGSIIEQEIETLLNYLINEGKTNFVALLPNNTYGSHVNEILKKKLRVKNAYLINTEFYTQSAELFESKLLKLLKSYRVSEDFTKDYEEKKSVDKKYEYIVKEEDKIYPEVLLIVDGEKIAQNVGIVMYKNPKISNNIQLVATSKVEGGKNLENNMYLNNMLFIGSNPYIYNSYDKKYQDIYNESPIKISTIIYDLVNNIDKFFVKEDGTYMLDKERLLNPYGYSGLDGRFRFLPNGLIERNYYMLQLRDQSKALISNSEEFLNY